jgi:hypothetical protein
MVEIRKKIENRVRVAENNISSEASPSSDRGTQILKMRYHKVYDLESRLSREIQRRSIRRHSSVVSGEGKIAASGNIVFLGCRDVFRV